MRLLELKPQGDFSLTKELTDNIPPYAILSHTWGSDDDELTFQELISGSGKTKKGYEKIRFCGEQASRHGLQHFWVDTCCIDKTNSAILAESINSMFRWYRNAIKCYVYLTDVSAQGHNQTGQSSPQWEQEFRKSRWFTRGWTLQELIAPASVEFFSVEGTLLGSKATLEKEIHEVTTIPSQALRGHVLSDFSVDERMSWTKPRNTKREEDGAYCLLGIFNIYLPLIYGEGRENAFIRLWREINERSKTKVQLDNQSERENDASLQRLPFAVEAPFNSYEKQHAPICLQNTRVDVLKDIFRWADESNNSHIFWLNGQAGTGKSTIARTVARKFFEQGRLGASFFFSRGGGDVGHAGKLISTLAAQMAQHSAFCRYIAAAVKECKDVAKQALRDQWQQLVLHPLLKLDAAGPHAKWVIVIDALDECDDDKSVRVILQLLAEIPPLKTVQLRVFLTSRPETPIRHGFRQIPDADHQKFVLHDIPLPIVGNDISNYFRSEFENIRADFYLRTDWVQEEDIARLVENANGLFIWAATACRFVREGGQFADDRLSMVLGRHFSATDQFESSDTDASTSIDVVFTPEKQLNLMYITVIDGATKKYKSQERKRFRKLLKDTIAAIVLLFNPLSTLSLARLLDSREEKIIQTLNDLHSIIDIPGDRTRAIRPHHPSFRDFILDKSRCGELLFVDGTQAHKRLAENCMRLMSKALKQDICTQGNPVVLYTNVKPSSITKYLPPELQYACLHWVQHVHQSGIMLSDNDLVHVFLQKSMIFWLEALSWMRKLDEGIYAISSLESLGAQANRCPQLCLLLYDVKRLILFNKSIIQKAPLQLYHGVLCFAPSTSQTRICFKDLLPKYVKTLSQVPGDWGFLIQTIQGHYEKISNLVFSSPDGKILASSSLYEQTIRLWNTKTGAALQALEEKGAEILDIAFKPGDAKVLASASGDCAVRLWDTVSGTIFRILAGHSQLVTSISFSQDGGRILASGSGDTTVILWNSNSGTALRTLRGHSDMVLAVAFSPSNTKLLASASKDKRVRLWDTKENTIIQSFEIEALFFDLHDIAKDSHVLAFSPHPGRELLVGVGYGAELSLFDIYSGKASGSLNGHAGEILAVAVSPDDSMPLVLATAGGNVSMWDCNSRELLHKIRGMESGPPSTVATYSPDSKVLALGNRPGKITLCDPRAILRTNRRDAHDYGISTLVFSSDGTVLASGSCNGTIQLWDTQRGSEVSFLTLRGHMCKIKTILFSSDNKTLAAEALDYSVILWNTKSGEMLNRIEIPGQYINTIAFFPDDSTLSVEQRNGVVKRWDIQTGLLKDNDLNKYWDYDALPESSPSPVGFSHYSVSEQWVYKNNKRFLWLSLDSQNGCSRTYKDTIALGHEDGRVTIVTFFPDDSFE